MKNKSARLFTDIAPEIKRLDKVGRQSGDPGLVQREIAEDLFYRNVQQCDV